jgi:hypothetical protein
MNEILRKNVLTRWTLWAGILPGKAVLIAPVLPGEAEPVG